MSLKHFLPVFKEATRIKMTRLGVAPGTTMQVMRRNRFQIATIIPTWKYRDKLNERYIADSCNPAAEIENASLMLHIPPSLPEFLMSEALKEAEKAAALNEVPVGAVLAVNGEIVARAHNRIESDSCVSAHAEMLVIQEASRARKNWRLEDAVLCVTLEPCSMCTGAILLSRIPVVIFGAGDSRQGAMGSLYDLSSSADFSNQLRVIRNIRGESCASMLAEFFKSRR